MTEPEELNSPALGGDRAQTPPPPPEPEPEPAPAADEPAADAADPDFATIFGAILGEAGLEAHAQVELNQSFQAITQQLESVFNVFQERLPTTIAAVENLFDAVEQALEPIFQPPPDQENRP